MTCPNCSAGEISPLTHRCELCGYVPDGLVVVETPRTEAVDDVARVELAEQFRFDEFLGRGEASAVYLAREQGSNRQIVVKVLPRPGDRRPDLDERFQRAVESVAALEHPHIVPIFGHGWSDHLYWYSMEHVRGRSLRDFLLQRGRMDLKACLRVVAQVASALDYAHRHGIVHGALKPANVLIDADGWVHVSDLLVRRIVEARPPAPPAAPAAEVASRPAARPSTPATPARERSPHEPPEALCTPSSDQYALAVLVTECLDGVPRGETGSETAAPAASLTHVPPHVRQAIHRALSPKPMDRFTGVLDFVAALETYSPVAVAQPSGRSSGVVLRQTDWKPPSRPLPWRLAIGAAATVAIAAVGVWQGPVVVQAIQRVFGRAQPAAVAPTPAESLARVAPPAGSTAVALPPAAPTRPAATVSRRQSTPPREARARREPPRGAAPVAAAPAPAPAAATPTPAPATPAPPAEPGHLFVSATPWGQLFVDGQLVGTTPKADLALSPGPHTIRVVREGFAPFERSLQVASGQVVRLTDIVLAPQQP